MYQLPHLFSLPCRLLDGTKMTEYFNLWLQFQIAFKQVTGKTLQLKLKKYALIVTIASIYVVFHMSIIEDIYDTVLQTFS
ncbi:unnamed protein product, partial [Timema podura]|nr:unnamed protein product [Timema podura]